MKLILNLCLLFCYQDVIVSESGTSDALNQHYINALRKYEAIKDEYDSLRKRYDDLISSHTSAVNKLELAQVYSFYYFRLNSLTLLHRVFCEKFLRNQQFSDSPFL
jgi:hypothetical protein